MCIRDRGNMAWAVELSTSGEAWASCRNFRRPKGNFFLDIPFIEPRIGTDPLQRDNTNPERSLDKIGRIIRIDAAQSGSSSVVEHRLAKARVASSSLVSRSN